MLDQTDTLPALPPAVAEYIEAHTRTTQTGMTYLVSEGGIPLFNSFAPGCPNLTPAELAAWSRIHRRDLWTETL